MCRTEEPKNPSKATGTRRIGSKGLSGHICIDVVAASVQYTVLHKPLLFLFFLSSSPFLQVQSHIHPLSATCWSWSSFWHRTSFPKNLRAACGDLHHLSTPTSDKLHTQQSILSPSPVGYLHDPQVSGAYSI